MKEKTQSAIAFLIVLGAIGSLFFTVNELGARLIQTLASIIVGYYFGARALPLSAFGKGNKKK